MKPSGDLPEPRDFIAAQPGPVDRAKALSRIRFDALVAQQGKGNGPGQINSDNVGEWCEVVVSSVVDELGMSTQDQHLEIEEWNTVFADLLAYAYAS